MKVAGWKARKGLQKVGQEQAMIQPRQGSWKDS